MLLIQQLPEKNFQIKRWQDIFRQLTSLQLKLYTIWNIALFALYSSWIISSSPISPSIMRESAKICTPFTISVKLREYSATMFNKYYISICNALMSHRFSFTKRQVWCITLNISLELWYNTFVCLWVSSAACWRVLFRTECVTEPKSVFEIRPTKLKSPRRGLPFTCWSNISTAPSMVSIMSTGRSLETDMLYRRASQVRTACSSKSTLCSWINHHACSADNNRRWSGGCDGWMVTTMVQKPDGCFTNVSRALQNNLAKIHNTRNHIYDQNFMYKVSAWKSDHKHYICNTQISRNYFGELAKR